MKDHQKQSLVSTFGKDDLMANHTKNTKVYTKAQIIQLIAKRVRIRRSLVQKIYEGFEDEIRELLASANDAADVSLRLFEGISIDGRYLAPKDKVNNLTGEKIKTMEKIRAKAKITRHYNEKLSSNDDEQP